MDSQNTGRGVPEKAGVDQQSVEPIDLVLDRLDGVSEDGKGWLARCPAEGHKDQNPSLSVREGDDGRVLLYCRSRQCDVADIVAGIDLTVADLFPNADPRSPRTDPSNYKPKGSDEERSITDIYRYTDEHGELLYSYGRTADKEFPVWHPEGDSYGWGYDGRRVLYHLPEVVATVANGGTVHVCAGEKDADAVRMAGATATTNPGGEGNWHDEYSERLRGATVVLWQDKDAAGRLRTSKVMESLERVDATVRVVEAAEGKDAYDHLQAGKTLAEVVPVAPVSSACRWLTGPELAALTPEDPDYVLRPYLARGLILQLTGKVKGGKTTFAMHMAASLLGGRPFLEES